MIPKKYLLLLAGLVWGAADFNILWLGLLAYVGLVKPLYLLLSAAVFVIFRKWFSANWYKNTLPASLLMKRQKSGSGTFSTGNPSSSWRL